MVGVLKIFYMYIDLIRMQATVFSKMGSYLTRFSDLGLAALDSLVGRTLFPML